MKKRKSGSAKPKKLEPDYPLQGSKLDLPLATVLSFSPEDRRKYILNLLSALGRQIKADNMALKKRVSFKREMRDLRNLLYMPADKYLYTDDKTFKRNVLGKGSPGWTHTYWSRKNMWKMETKGGDLSKEVLKRAPKLVAKLDKLFDITNIAKEIFRERRKTAVETALLFLQLDKASGTAFPPFHSKFFADRFLPKEGDGIVLDQSAGWGGRLIGCLCVQRSGHVRYYATDPEKRNKKTYGGLIRRVNVWLKNELPGKRSARIFYQPFEDWIQSRSAKRLRGRVDLCLTSPPYWSAENYNPENPKQSANRYPTYEEWREKFYRVLFKGAFKLLRPGGVFVLNIANVAGAPRLEADARKLAVETGFENAGFYKLAMSVTPGKKGAKIRHTLRVNGKTFKHEPCFCFRRPSIRTAI